MRTISGVFLDTSRGTVQGPVFSDLTICFRGYEGYQNVNPRPMAITRFFDIATCKVPLFHAA
jgi:hypothetical protein